MADTPVSRRAAAMVKAYMDGVAEREGMVRAGEVADGGMDGLRAWLTERLGFEGAYNSMQRSADDVITDRTVA